MRAGMPRRTAALLAALALGAVGCRDILGIHELWDNSSLDGGDAATAEASPGEQAEASDSSEQDSVADRTTGPDVDGAVDGDATHAADAPEAGSELGTDAKAEEGGDGAVADGPAGSTCTPGGSCGSHSICVGGSCVTKCDSTTCANGCCNGDTCVTDETIAACGTAGAGCSTCSAPSNGVAACNGQAGCGFTCTAGYVVCNSACCPQVVVTGGTLFATQGVEMGGVVATLADAATGEAASALTAFIDWGDGTTSYGNVSGSSGAFTVSTKHTYVTYPANGKATVSITVTSGSTNASGVSTVTATVRPASTATITEFPGLTAGAVSIAASSDGNLWFSEYTKIGVITTTGTVSEFPLLQGANALGLVIDAASRSVWFADPNGAIGLFDTMSRGSIEYFPPGTFVSRPSGGITWGPDGNLWFTEAAGMNARGPLGRFTPGTNAFVEFAQPVSVGGSGAFTVVSGPDGNIWFPDNGGYIGGTPAITRFMLSNNSLTKFPRAVPSGYVAVDITVGPDGKLWFSDGAGIGRLATDGTLLAHFSLATPPGGLNGMTSGPDHNIWFTETNKIARLTTTGALTEFPVATANCCGAIVTGPDSNIWFADGTAIGRIQP
jgi:streptogramin lyase